MKRTIIVLALIGLALFLIFKKTNDHADAVSSENILINVKKNKPKKLEAAVQQKDFDPKVEVPSDVNNTTSTLPPRDQAKPQALENVMRFEGSEDSDPGYIEWTPSCDGCKPSASMTLVNAVTGVRVKAHKPNSSAIKDLVPGARKTFGFQGTCGFEFPVILIFNYDSDPKGKAQFQRFVYRIKGRGIQEEKNDDLLSQEFITELNKTFSLADCKAIQAPP